MRFTFGDLPCFRLYPTLHINDFALDVKGDGYYEVDNMNKLELQTMMSAVRTAITSAVDQKHLDKCKALKAFDDVYDGICFENESEILLDLGFIPPKVKCKGCCGSTCKDVPDL